MTKAIVNLVASLLDRCTLWRLGRALYLKARADTPNIMMQSSGEVMMQRQLLSEFARNGETLVIFDVGANVGDWTWFILQESAALKMKGQLEIHSFEPAPSTFETLRGRIGKHPRCALVHLVPHALSSEEGIGEMFIVGENAETNSLHIDGMNNSAQRIHINKITADAYCLKNNIKIIHYFKCDAEGHDMKVLYGARRLFEEQRVMVCQFEYNHRWVYSRFYLKDIFDYAKNIPYTIGKITPRGVEIYDEWHPELERFFEGNYVLIHDNALHWFSMQRGAFDVYNTYGVHDCRAKKAISLEPSVKLDSNRVTHHLHVG